MPSVLTAALRIVWGSHRYGGDDHLCNDISNGREPGSGVNLIGQAMAFRRNCLA